MSAKLAIANLVDSRLDFYQKRKPLVEEELRDLEWLRQDFDHIESGTLQSPRDIQPFAQEALCFGAQALVIHLPIWADPIFTVRLTTQLTLPVLLLGNNRPETSSMVGMLGAGGALDQLGRSHVRVFDQHDEAARRQVRAFVRAAATLSQLHGQTLGLFGGRSLGIFTAMADAAQWQRLFGVDIEFFDQLEIVDTAEALPEEEVKRFTCWLLDNVASAQFNPIFTMKAFERQMRSYIATRKLILAHGVDFVGVKCQPEMSDGYVSQCVSHMLLNSGLDADGQQPVIVHACESDADGALSMQILHLISGGKPASLLDIRWFDQASGLWALANCGAIPAAFCATPADPVGLAGMCLVPHVFGRGGGGALTAQVSPQRVTLARLCRKNGSYWMAIIAGAAESGSPEVTQRTTPAFPKAFIRSSAGLDFLNEFGSNHIHMVSGDFAQELVAFCRLAGIEYKLWN